MTSSGRESAVFTGAGISGEAPAGLPRGNDLRNRILGFVHGMALTAAPGGSVTDHQLAELVASARKLEVVLGRLWGTIGSDALRCLLALRLEVPNRAHMLAAIHLMRGGTHVTLNFDVGVELAYDLLAGRRTLPAGARAQFDGQLKLWLPLVPHDPSHLEVVATHRQFDEWARSPRPALLKVHGSLTYDQDELADPVVVDNEELAALQTSRLAAVLSVRGASELVITGYSGADPDVYRPLLSAVPPVTRWCCFSLGANSPVPGDLAARGIDLRLGRPDGMAEKALEDLLGSRYPSWPQVVLPGDQFAERLAAWSQECARRHAPSRFALAWAWLLADLGDHDSAVSIIEELTRDGHQDPALLVRFAEVLYIRSGGTDRERARGIFRQVVHDRSADLGLRLHSRLRLADITRGRAIHGQGLRGLAASLVTSTAIALTVIVKTRNGRSQPEMTADAYRLVQQTGMRAIERAASRLTPRYWPGLAVCCRVANAAGTRAQRLNSNGNRAILLRQRQCHLDVLAALLRRRQPPPAVEATLRELHDSYWNADDRNGAGNCTVSLALATAAAGPAKAFTLLDQAEDEYRQATATGEPLPSCSALLQVGRAIVSRIG